MCPARQCAGARGCVCVGGGGRCRRQCQVRAYVSVAATRMPAGGPHRCVVREPGNCDRCRVSVPILGCLLPGPLQCFLPILLTMGVPRPVKGGHVTLCDTVVLAPPIHPSVRGSRPPPPPPPLHPAPCARLASFIPMLTNLWVSTVLRTPGLCRVHDSLQQLCGTCCHSVQGGGVHVHVHVTLAAWMWIGARARGLRFFAVCLTVWAQSISRVPYHP